MALTVEEQIQRLSEAQRIDFQRRLDSCNAVIASIESLVLDRRQTKDDILQFVKYTTSWWSWVPLVVAVALFWLGRAFELTFATNIGYAVGAVWFLAMANWAFADWSARRRQRELDATIATYRYHWTAAGGRWATFTAYCSLVEKLDRSPDYSETGDIRHKVHLELLTCVGR